MNTLGRLRSSRVRTWRIVTPAVLPRFPLVVLRLIANSFLSSVPDTQAGFVNEFQDVNTSVDLSDCLTPGQFCRIVLALRIFHYVHRVLPELVGADLDIRNPRRILVEHKDYLAGAHPRHDPDLLV